ncbi:hypothetical protein DY000_02022325 [Brassica cretica]|uniref:Uncharacterized protein n=1 Tax=Brassica cretica TaxID=69181 RepID=A0ABQ7EIR8_BRACR|nr:hypothetical protein DY000_02022325 [Brassica cretica]
MEGSPYRKFSISWKGARFQGPNSGFLLAGTWSVPLSGTRGSGSCLEAGGNNTRIFFPNSLPLISRFRHRSRGIICALKSTGVAHSQQAPLRQDPVPLVLLAWVPLKPELILNPGWSSEIRTTRGLQRVGEMILVMGFSRSHFPYRASRLVFPRSLTFLTRVGTRVHSRRRVGKEACESMDSSESSLDVTAEIKELRNAAVGEAPPPPGGDRFSPVGPLSIIGVEEVSNWRKKFRLPDDVIIRIPGPFDRVSDFELGEITVYEVKISPGQLNHPSWRILIAMQSLGDLEGFTVGVAEVPYCYFVSPLNGGEFRYHLHPRGKALPVRELSKAERKRCPVFEGCWTLKFAFMPFLGFSPTWCAADISRSDYSSGRDTIEQLLELPLERREVSFLVSDEALDRCSIRGVMSGSKGVEALAKYRKALETMSARKAAVKRTAPIEDEEVQFVGSSRRQVNAVVAPSSSKKKSKASDSVPKTPSPASFDWSAVLSNLNAKAFPLVPAHLSLGGDSFVVIRSLQGDLLQERMEDKTTAKAEVDALTTQLREGKDAVLAKEKEIKALKLKVQNQGEAMERVATENASLQRRLEGKEEDICESRYAAEVFDAEKAMAVNGAKVMARWELMREWLRHQTDSWEIAAALEQYKIVKTTEAELLGLPAPCFDYEPQVPERGGAPEPADDLHLSFACLSFVFGIFSFVGDTHVVSVIAPFFERSQDLGRMGSRCYGCRRTHGSRVLRFLRTFGLCNDQTSWVSYDWISSGDPGVGWRILTVLGPGGLFLGNPRVLDPESSFSEPGIKVLKGPHSAILGEATLGTYWGIAFYRSEAGHYRVHVLHAAFCRKPLSDSEGASVGENPSARLCYFPRLEK